MNEKFELNLLIGDIMSDVIGGFENTLEDYNPDCEEYKVAEDYLRQSHEDLICCIYDELVPVLERSEYKHLKFFGTVAIKMLIDVKLTAWNY